MLGLGSFLSSCVFFQQKATVYVYFYLHYLQCTNIYYVWDFITVDLHLPIGLQSNQSFPIWQAH